MTAPSDHDPVHQPSHYTSGKVECIDAIEAALGPEGFIAFLRGQVIKYNWRLGKKDAPAQEAGKAKWYMDLLERKLKVAEEPKPEASAKWQQSTGPLSKLAPSLQLLAQNPATAAEHRIQGEALTDNQTVKEISNGTVIDNRIYGTAEWLAEHYGQHHQRRSDGYPGWHFIVDFSTTQP